MDKYCYKGTDVLINKFDVRENGALSKIEAQYSYFRIMEIYKEGLNGCFDLKHLQMIHKYIFQDVYPWAGELRTVDIGKGYTQFAHNSYLVPEANKLFSQLQKDNLLINSKIDGFAERIAYYASELNMLHPFREGNGRAIRTYLTLLSQNAGYKLDFGTIDIDKLYHAFVKSIVDYTELGNVFKDNIVKNIKDRFIKEWPAVRLADTEFFSKLIKITRQQDISIADLKSMYIDLGKKIESGIQPVDDKFNMLSDLITDIKKYNMQYSKDIESVPGKGILNDKNMSQEP